MRKRNASPSAESDNSFIEHVKEHVRVLSRVVTPAPKETEPDVETATFVNQIPPEPQKRPRPRSFHLKAVRLLLALCALSTPLCLVIAVVVYDVAIRYALVAGAIITFFAALAYPKQFDKIRQRIRYEKDEVQWIINIFCILCFFFIWSMRGPSQGAQYLLPIALHKLARSTRRYIWHQIREELNERRPFYVINVMKDLPHWVRRYYINDALVLPTIEMYGL